MIFNESLVVNVCKLWARDSIIHFFDISASRLRPLPTHKCVYSFNDVNSSRLGSVASWEKVYFNHRFIVYKTSSVYIKIGISGICFRPWSYDFTSFGKCWEIISGFKSWLRYNNSTLLIRLTDEFSSLVADLKDGLFRKQRPPVEGRHGLPKIPHAIRWNHDQGMVQRIQGNLSKYVFVSSHNLFINHKAGGPFIVL